jgi:hypothetical protein
MLADVVDPVVGGGHAPRRARGGDGESDRIADRHDRDRQQQRWVCSVGGVAGRACAGPRVVAAVDGTRKYGIGLSRALAAAGLPLIE